MKPRPIGNGKTGALSSSCSVGIVDEGDESTYFKKQVVAFFFEKRVGTLVPGKLADIVIMDRNLFDAFPTELLESRPIYTIVDGKIVYQRAHVQAG